MESDATAGSRHELRYKGTVYGLVGIKVSQMLIDREKLSKLFGYLATERAIDDDGDVASETGD